MYNDCPFRWKLNYVDKLSISESNIHLIFGSAMHEVLQTYLNIMYMDSVKNADVLDLNKMLRDKLIEQFKQAEEQGHIGKDDLEFVKKKLEEKIELNKLTGEKTLLDLAESPEMKTLLKEHGAKTFHDLKVELFK